ncbi:MAG TPA: DUF4132 domain-containing protein [Anaerolineaceae bacterium]|nr:DUF4132 domain-containing protein [Anaerolineaceae bacterium]
MFLFNRKKKENPPEPEPDPMLKLVQELSVEDIKTPYFWTFKLRETHTGQKILALKSAERRLFILAALRWLGPENEAARSRASILRVRVGILEALHKQIDFEEVDLIQILDLAIWQTYNQERGIPQMIKTLEHYLKTHPQTEALVERVEKLIELVGQGYMGADDRRQQTRLRELIRSQETDLPLEPGEPWSDTVFADLKEMPVEQQLHWVRIFNLCAKASGSSPAEKWRAEAARAVEDLGYEHFKCMVLKWFPLTDQPYMAILHDVERKVETLHPASTDLLRALVWIGAMREDREMARGLTALAIASYRKLPGTGPRAAKLGNACVWSLGAMPGSDGVGQLALLKVRVKFIPAQKAIETALQTAAERLHLPAEEIEEMSVPSYGLEEVGLRRETLGEHKVELVIDGKDVELSWFQAGGKKISAAPKAVKDAYGEELKELSQAKKDIEKMLPAQAARIENLYLEQKSWKYADWRERYLDHPLVGTLARRLIWTFSRDDQSSAGIWWDGQMVDSEGRPVVGLDGGTRVELWHPIFSSTEMVLAWRAWLEQHQLRQPFKQAHREIYLLTDAERQTRVYSNRYASHIIKQHQFHALCGQRGWKNKLRLMVDDECPPATRLLSPWDLRAEFWVESLGDTYRADTNEAGSYLYLTTDQVRFYRLAAPENTVHATGGGYHSWRQPAAEPLALDEIPALVFSEIMRDADLFVGVASVGNDPSWLDGGREPRQADYWSGYSFGSLTESAQTRKQVLERLVPRLKIAPRCSFTDRFLVVRGDLRTYKIHLGSGNILMEPNDQYLCIVAAHGAGSSPNEKVFLPFEGDNTLSVILSKAFLLADDKKISDPTITRQIKPA